MAHKKKQQKQQSNQNNQNIDPVKVSSEQTGKKIDADEKTRDDRVYRLKKYGVRAFFLLLLPITVGVFMQGLPLIFMFVAGYIGLPQEASLSDVDTMVFLLTSFSVALLVLYGIVQWMRFVWHRGIKNPASFLKPPKYDRR